VESLKSWNQKGLACLEYACEAGHVDQVREGAGIASSDGSERDCAGAHV